MSKVKKSNRYWTLHQS